MAPISGSNERRIAWDAKGALLAYRDWPKLREPPESVSVDNWPIGQSGILYPVSVFTERIFDPMARKLSPSAVEPWFHLNLQLTRTPRCVIGRELPRLHKFKDCLWKINLKRNDGHIRKIAEYLWNPKSRK